MTTTVQANLGGFAFTIEAEAYNDLEQYLSDIRTCFRNDAYAAEIVEDIEVRIAELLREKCSDGMTVTSSMVQDIRKRIGNPDDLAREETESPADASDTTGGKKEKKQSWRNKRMYRDIDNRMLGGVCSGLGEYLNVDKVVFRILFLVFFLVGFFDADKGLFTIAIAVYGCLWIAMPAARTVEEKCEMKRKPINLEGFKEQENNLGREIREAADSPITKGVKRGGKLFLGILMLMCGFAGCLASLFVISVPEVIARHETDILTHHGQFSIQPEDQIIFDTFTDPIFGWLALAVCGIFFVWFLYNGVMLAFDLKTPSWRPGLVIFILWLISILVLATWAFRQMAELIPLMM